MMNSSADKNKEEISENFLIMAMKFYDEGKSVSDILALFPDQKEELKRIFGAINVLRKQKEIISAPKGLLRDIVAAVALKKGDKEAGVTSAKSNRYLFKNDYTKGRFFNFNMLNMFIMKKMYVGVIVLLLIVTAAGVLYRQVHRKGNASAVMANLSEDANKLALEQKEFGQNVADLKEAGTEDAALRDVNQDLADISGEKIVNSTSKMADIAYVEALGADFAAEIANLSSNLQSIEGIDSDSSLNNLDSELKGI